MQIIDIKINELVPYENNPRLNEKAVEAVANSIAEFGFKVPIVIDKNNVIIAGHTRLKAAKALGYTTVPCLIADDLSEDQVKAFRLADNKVAELAEWDNEKLEEELRNIEMDMTQFAFNMADLTDELKKVEQDNFDADDEYDKIQEPTAKLGDIWQLGRHRLICGDSTDPETIKTLLDGEKVELLITDPPYNVNYGAKGKTYKQNDLDDRYGISDRTIMNDNMGDERFRDFLTDSFKAANIGMKNGAAFYIWHSDSEGYNFRLATKKAGWQLRQCLIWVKNALVIGRQDYQWRHEPCLYGWKDGAAHYFVPVRTHTTVIDDKVNISKLSLKECRNLLKQFLEPKEENTVLYEDKPVSSAEHPTMKPVKLIARIMANSSRVGESVLDIFGGSGTTLVVAEQLDRTCYMVELDPKFVDVIVKRWETMTGEKAKLIRG